MKTISRDARKEISEYFLPRLSKQGSSPEAVGWNNANTQESRFKTVCEVDSLEDAYILDVGCGLGHLYGYLCDHVHTFSYLGVDILEKMVVRARIDYPEASFEQVDILQLPSERRFDYSLAVGVYNLEVGDNDMVMKQIIRRMFEISRKGVAASMTYGGRASRGQSHGFDPYEMLRFCHSMSPWVALRKDYLDNDFTVYLYREPRCSWQRAH